MSLIMALPLLALLARSPDKGFPEPDFSKPFLVIEVSFPLQRSMLDSPTKVRACFESYSYSPPLNSPPQNPVQILHITLAVRLSRSYFFFIMS